MQVQYLHAGKNQASMKNHITWAVLISIAMNSLHTAGVQEIWIDQSGLY